MFFSVPQSFLKITTRLDKDEVESQSLTVAIVCRAIF